MKLLNHLYKVLIDDIILRVAIEFINHDKDDHQQEEEEFNNDTSLMSYDEEEEKGIKSEDEDGLKCKLK